MDSYDRSRSLTLALVILLVNASCTTTPVIDRSWISSNCQSVGLVRSDNGIQHQFSNGDTWAGPVLNGKLHGLGKYRWAKDDSTFTGEFNQGSQWCGVEVRGSNFIVYRNGKGEHGKAGVDWGTVAAAILVVGVVGAAAAAASSGGGYAAPQQDYDWDWDAFYNQNYILQWRCRGVQTGQFAADSNCAYDLKDDDRWPAK